MIIETSEGPAILLENLKRLELRDGDYVVLMTHQRLPAQAIESIRDTLTKFFGSDRKVLVLAEGMQLAVIGEAA